MKPTWLHSLLWLQAVLIIALGGALAYFGRNEIPGPGYRENAEVAAPAPTVEGGRPGNPVGGQPGVRVTATARAASGIEVSPAVGYVFHPRDEAFGTVVGLQSLLQLRAQLQAALAEQQAAKVALARADNELQRMQALYADERNVSQRALQTAESDRAAALARSIAAGAGADNLQAQLRQGWGEPLATWASADPPPANFTRLLERQVVLLQIVAASAPPATIDVALPGIGNGLDKRTFPARYISPAPQTEPGTVGLAHFYLCESSALAAGARIVARLPLAGEGRRGVRVPAGALVWHGGKAWVYLQRDAEHFERHDVTGASAIGDEWFIANLAAGSAVVTAGAQILLSEEMRYQIKNENED